MTPELFQEAAASVGWEDAITPHVAPALLSRGARRRVRSALVTLPSAVSHVYLECRLQAHENQVDVIAGVRRTARVGLSRGGWRLHRRIHARNRGARLDAFVRRWAHHDADLTAVMGLWFEYDLATARGSLAALMPSVFVETDWNTRDMSPRQCCAAIQSLYRELTGTELASDAAVHLEACYRSLPPGASIPYIGIMLGRPAHPVRACVLGLSADTTPRYLHEVSWPGDWRRIGYVLAAAGQSRGRHGAAFGLVHIDLGRAVSPVVGAELVFARRNQVLGVIAESRLLELLVRWELCERAKAAGLLLWPGYSTARLDGEPWQSVFVRRINNIKFVLGHDGAIQTKAYLCTTKRPRCELHRARAWPWHTDGRPSGPMEQANEHRDVPEIRQRRAHAAR